VAEFAVQILKRAGLVPLDAPDPDWDAFLRVQRGIERFTVPWTTITSLMRRFFFALSAATRPAYVVGAGTYVGFGLAWLVTGQARGEDDVRLVEAVGLDVDADATALAGRNAEALGLGPRLRFEQAEAVGWLRAGRGPISLLYIDIDAPGSRKGGYLDVLEAARPRLRPGAVVVAHDACVPLFAEDFDRFHAAVDHDAGFVGRQVLPLDECGVSVCRVA
jgi:predicted O-methyltransferase YrrM